MNWWSLRSNRLKFKDFMKLTHITVEKLWEHTSNSWRKIQRITTCFWTWETLGFWPIMPKNLPRSLCLGRSRESRELGCLLWFPRHCWVFQLRLSTLILSSLCCTLTDSLTWIISSLRGVDHLPTIGFFPSTSNKSPFINLCIYLIHYCSWFTGTTVEY